MTTERNRTGRVLLVEDEPQVRDIACRILVEDGYDVFEAQDGDEAMEVLKLVGPVDLVVTDVVMPSVDGPTLVRRLLERDAAQRYLYISAWEPAMLEQRGGRPDDATFLAKPFTADQLRLKVTAALIPRDR